MTVFISGMNDTTRQETTGTENTGFSALRCSTSKKYLDAYSCFDSHLYEFKEDASFETLDLDFVNGKVTCANVNDLAKIELYCLRLHCAPELTCRQNYPTALVKDQSDYISSLLNKKCTVDPCLEATASSYPDIGTHVIYMAVVLILFYLY